MSRRLKAEGDIKRVRFTSQSFLGKLKRCSIPNYPQTASYQSTSAKISFVPQPPYDQFRSLRENVGRSSLLIWISPLSSPNVSRNNSTVNFWRVSCEREVHVAYADRMRWLPIAAHTFSTCHPHTPFKFYLKYIFDLLPLPLSLEPAVEELPAQRRLLLAR